MLSADALDRIDREISFLKRASWSGWGKVPEFVGATVLVPEMEQGGALAPVHDQYTQGMVAKAVERARAYVAQQNALDAPFLAMAKERAKGVVAAASEASGGLDALGLVFNATSGTQDRVEARRLPREKLLVNRDAQRVKRLRTSVGHVARLLHFDAHSEREAQRWNKKFITLTYADADAWRPNHFSRFRDSLRQWCKRRKLKCRYVWVAEIQMDRLRATGKAVVHYHVVVWLPKGYFLPASDTQGWWPHGKSNTKTAESPVSYIAKYASKTTAVEAGLFPKGARMHGHGGLEPEGRRHVRYWMAPMWVRDELSGRADIRKVSGGYVDKFTGEFLASPWRVCIGPGGEVWTYRIDQEETKQ